MICESLFQISYHFQICFSLFLISFYFSIFQGELDNFLYWQEQESWVRQIWHGLAHHFLAWLQLWEFYKLRFCVSSPQEVCEIRCDFVWKMLYNAVIRIELTHSIPITFDLLVNCICSYVSHWIVTVCSWSIISFRIRAI